MTIAFGFVRLRVAIGIQYKVYTSRKWAGFLYSLSLDETIRQARIEALRNEREYATEKN